MPVTLDATVGGANSNAYGDETEGDTHFAGRLNALPWTSLTGAEGIDQKRRALISATARLEQEPWDGYVTSLTQRLAFPRAGLEDHNGHTIDHTIIPRFAKEAMFETALDLLSKASDVGAPDPLAKFSAIKIGEIQINLRESAPVNGDFLRDSVQRLIARHLLSSTDFSRG